MSERSHLVPLVARLGEARVACIGDVMLDRYVYGGVERISPEAPIPILKVERETAMPGGAGNVVRNLAALGARVRFAAAVGDDAAGRELAALFEREGRVRASLTVEPGRRTAIKTRYVAGVQQLLRADAETVAPLAEATRQAILDFATADAEDGVLVLSDYGKGVLDGNLAAELIAAARRRGRMVIVDPKGTDYGRYRGANVLTPNRKELAEATGLSTASDAQVVAAARRLIGACALDAVVATRSREGMTLVTAVGEVAHLAAEAREVFDVSGAGDTVVATLAAALAVGADLPAAAALANAAAGIVVGKIGTAVAFARELVSALHHQDLAGAEAKVMALEPALDRIQAWRLKGLRIGFTNGCFDLLHPGHVALFRHARAGCDRLVVGVNSDASVRRLKGPDRPVQSEAARATVLASLATVDLVVVFAEDTPLELIRAIRPDVLVKGADWALDQVVGADVVQGYGGKVLLAPLEPGFSTSATIARLVR